ncbi:hypothetical protein HanPI659440_Chr04g0166641 [Helianthus annuus]|nr:hypothetical protein HanPI659440_Chr04g0166641 [Helianthus annuus]
MYVCVLLGLVVPEKPLEGFHIIVDAGNRAGGFFCWKGAGAFR